MKHVIVMVDAPHGGQDADDQRWSMTIYLAEYPPPPAVRSRLIGNLQLDQEEIERMKGFTQLFDGLVRVTWAGDQVGTQPLPAMLRPIAAPLIRLLRSVASKD